MPLTFLDTEDTNINEVHGELTFRAAERANRDPNKDPRFFFRPMAVGSQQTRKGIDGLCLEWDPDQQISTLPLQEQEGVIQTMERIGKRALQETIVDNLSLFAGLIIGEARQGRNYFDHFHGTTEDSPANNSL